MLNLEPISNVNIALIWLYGSRALDSASDYSDYDIAIAFDSPVSKIESHQLIQQLSLHWLEVNQLLENQLSVVDIDLIPIPLAVNVIETGKLLYCSDENRYTSELSRIWGLWSDLCYYQKLHIPETISTKNHIISK